jgi:uncharacterized membrane protein
MDLDASKNLGGVGALLLVIAGVGFFGTPYVGLLGLVGIILVLIALKGMSDYYKEAGIFNNALYATITAIIGIVAFVGVVVASVLAFLSSLPEWAQTLIDQGDWAGLATAFQQHFTDFTDFSAIWALIGSVILALVVLFVFAIVAMILFRKSLGSLSTRSGVGLFGTTGLIMLIGAVLTIIVIGFLLIWIGWILLTVAFFSVKAQAAPQPTTQPMAPPPP